jgi:mono/diheme cytochrome c family protein
MRLLSLLLLGWLAAPASGAAGTPAGDPTQKLYLNKCARCHKPYDPASYDDQKWTYWMQKMKRKARLNDEQYQLLLGYRTAGADKPNVPTPR